ncbi:actin cytoskeleton-regulatory complex protein pan1-like [Solenopsis invicta]|uniref:actin cytoskeleton-regulatory complex protein pan1-like n=1 Tax=Solenopsis invicta TaxID=13686 RepID=UPI00193CAAEA|nr:actin cytoskeleton-regulatory complex protein pan1-like [Solenopsis invicta]
MGAGGLELFSPSSSPGNPPKKETRRLQVTLEDFLPKGGKARPTGSRPGPACSKGVKPDSCGSDETRLDPSSTPGPSGLGSKERPSLPPSPISAGVPIHMDVDSDAESVGRGRKRAHSKRSTPAYYISSSSESDEGPKKKGRGRPAKDPSHAGQFTAEALAKKAEANMARRIKKDHRDIVNPDVQPSSARAVKAQEMALERAEELEQQPIAAVAAVMTQSLGMLAKSVERSTNIQGPIRKDLWNAYADLTAGLTAILTRQEESPAEQAHREERAALAKAKAKWVVEKRRLEAELGQMRVRIALLEQASSMQATRECGTDVEVQTDLDLDDTVLGALTGGTQQGPSVETDREEPPVEEPSAHVETTRHRKLPVVVSTEILKEPYFRPPLKGVSKQLNPLSKVADRIAAPVSRSSFPALPPPSSSLETSGWARVGESGKKERKRAKALTEDGLKEALSRVLPAVLAEMGLLPAPRGAERPKAPPTAGKIARQSGVAPQKGADNAVAVAARPAPTTQKEATPSILELWTEVVSKKTRKKAAKAAERATKTAPPPAARPTRVLPIPPPKPTPQQPSTSSKKKKKRGGRGGGQGGPGGQTPGGAGSHGSGQGQPRSGRRQRRP